MNIVVVTYTLPWPSHEMHHGNLLFSLAGCIFYPFMLHYLFKNHITKNLLIMHCQIYIKK